MRLREITGCTDSTRDNRFIQVTLKLENSEDSDDIVTLEVPPKSPNETNKTDLYECETFSLTREASFYE